VLSWRKFFKLQDWLHHIACITRTKNLHTWCLNTRLWYIDCTKYAHPLTYCNSIFRTQKNLVLKHQVIKDKSRLWHIGHSDRTQCETPCVEAHMCCHKIFVSLYLDDCLYFSWGSFTRCFAHCWLFLYMVKHGENKKISASPN